MSRIPLAAFVLLATLAAAAEAQVCEGQPGRAAGNFALGAAFSSGNDASQFSAGITGIGKAVYGGASVGSIDYDGFSGSTTTVGGAVGYQLAVGTTGRAQLCPVVTATLGFGPNDIAGTGIDASARSFTAGLAWGFRATESADLSMIPTFGASFARSSVTFTDGVDDLTESDTYGQLSLGLGFVFARRFGITPAVMIPVGLEGADPMFALSARLALGGSR